MRARGGQRGEPPGKGWVAIGKLGKTFGLRGEVTVRQLAASTEVMKPGAPVLLTTANRQLHARVAAVRQQPNKLIIRFEGLDRIEDIESWVGATVEVRAEDLPQLEEGSYYHFELIGLEVYTADGRWLGTLAQILETGGNDIYCVRDGQREILVPAIRDAIAEVDLAGGRLVLKDLEGLLEP